MKKLGISLFILFTVTIVFQTSGFSDVQEYRLDAGESRLSFEVGATLHTVRGTAKATAGQVSFDPATGKAALPAQIQIPVSSLDTGNKRRDQHMRKMFQAEQYPVIQWSATQAACGPGEAENTMTCTTNGILKIRDIERETAFQIFLTLHEGHLKAGGTLIVNRKEFKLKPPSLLGIMRVDEDVLIEFETVWAPEPGSAAGL